MKRLASFLVALVFALVFSGTAFAAQDQSGSMSSGNQGAMMNTPRASEIIGMKVVGQDGHDLGKVKDLIVGENGAIDYLILSEAGGGNKMTAIPWDAANAQFQKNEVSIDLSKDKVDNAPTFANWSDFSKNNYEQNVRAYYGESGGMMQSPTQPRGESGMGTQSK